MKTISDLFYSFTTQAASPEARIEDPASDLSFVAQGLDTNKKCSQCPTAGEADAFLKGTWAAAVKSAIIPRGYTLQDPQPVPSIRVESDRCQPRLVQYVYSKSGPGTLHVNTKFSELPEEVRKTMLFSLVDAYSTTQYFSEAFADGVSLKPQMNTAQDWGNIKYYIEKSESSKS